MESDLSLIEIAGEDDSLLQQIPALSDTTITATTTSKNYYFACSPLQVSGSNSNYHRSRLSPIASLRDNVNADEPTRSSPLGSSNKENITVNKSEVPKLRVEPQQMKRRKGGGAYNLRKSLAWDRAFFTEEGVLDPLELSILTGSYGNSSREVLPPIHEEGRKFYCNSSSASDSVGIEVLGENRFKESPATSSNKREKAGTSLAKHVSPARDNAAPTSVGTPKTFSNQKGNMTGSKSGGCPRPLVFTSLKRPANASTTKTAMKESKIPKIPASRLGAHSLPKSNKNNVLSTSNPKHNQIGQAENFPKSAGLHGTLKSTTNKVKAGSDSLLLTSKSSRQHPRINMTKLALEEQERSSTNPQPTVVTKANCGLQVFPAGVLPPTGSRAPDPHHVWRKTGIPPPQNILCTYRNTQSTQSQTTKPSGLRMPSPSLRFFGQPKSSDSNSSSQKATQPSNTLDSSNYSYDSRLPHVPGKMPKMDNSATISGNARVSGSSSECSVPCAGNDDANENRRFKFVRHNVSNWSDLTKENQEVHNLLDGYERFQKCGDPHKVVQISKDSDFQKNVNNWLLHCKSSDQLKEDGNIEANIVCPEHGDPEMNDLENTHIASQHSCEVPVKSVPGINNTVEHQFLEDTQYSSSVGIHEVISESLCYYAAGDINQDNVIMHNGNSSDIRDVDEWSGKKPELINASSGEADQIPHAENHKLMSNDGILLEREKLFECHKCKRENVASVNPNISESNSSEKLSSNSPPHERPEQENECSAGVHPLSLDTTFSSRYCDTKLHTSEVYDQYLVVENDNKKSGELPAPQSRCLAVEPTSELNHGFLSDGYSLLSESSPAEESQGINGLENALNVIPEKGDDPMSYLNYSNLVVTQNPGAVQDGGADVDEIVEQPQLKVALFSSAERVPPVENRKFFIDIQSTPDPSLKKSIDLMIGPVTTRNSFECCSLSKEEDMGANGLKNSILEDKAETRYSSENPHMDNERIEMNGGMLCGFHAGDTLNIVDVSLINQDFAGNELKSCQIASLFDNAKQANEGAVEVGKMTNIICMEDAKAKSLDGNLLDGSSNGGLSNSAVGKECSMAATEEPREEKVRKNVPFVQEQSDVDTSESKSHIVVIQLPLSMQGSGVDVEQVALHRLLEDEPSDPIDTEMETESDKYFIDTHLEHNMVCSGQVASSESDSALMMRDDQNFGVTTTDNEFCLSEESDFSVQKIVTTLANETNIVSIGVGKTNTILPDDIGVQISSKIVSPTCEHQHKLDKATCLAQEEDATMPTKKSEDSWKQNSLTIKPPTNAVPFSDEWLAAMEAAGEEVLTMKSGAVQNSPPEKSLPEPSPWSPVKRKQNDIGPFDCTKFINIPPPDSN